jgi:hypothetical protein
MTFGPDGLLYVSYYLLTLWCLFTRGALLHNIDWLTFSHSAITPPAFDTTCGFSTMASRMATVVWFEPRPQSVSGTAADGVTPLFVWSVFWQLA